uniref:SERPIN domain-containing protein n=1 Tax=Caenorhabditis tropicalis TaxID=1561998 RepID=A0A1I7V285_9PELO
MYYQAESELGLNFLKTLPAHNESLVFSPISIALVLSLVHAGALGNSKKQIENSLLNKANCNNCQFVNHFSNVYKSLKQGVNGVEVNMANRLYLKNGSTAKRGFLSAIAQNYGAEARALDFKTSDAMQKINGYVKSATKGKVDRIITCQDSIRSANGLLINAMSFKGGWEDGFPQFPGMQLFHKNERDQFWIGVLSETSIRGYSSDDLFQVLTLKYVDPRFQLSIFLPKKKHSLNDALKKLDNRRFENLLDNVKPTLVNAEIPKFSIDYRLSLKKSLKAVGITEIFSDFADLSGIADKAKVSEGIHKSAIQLTESGTGTGCPSASPAIGSGASPIGCGATVAKNIRVLPIVRSGNPVKFEADHPFLFALTYLNHSIFMGVYRGQ